MKFLGLGINFCQFFFPQAKVGLFRDDLFSPMDPSPCEKNAFKRPREVENGSAKRRKYNSLHTLSENSPRYKLQRSISETAATNLASVLHKSKSEIRVGLGAGKAAI